MNTEATKMKIDATSPEYQVSKDYAPDKEATYTYPMEKDGWMHSHNALRMEMSTIKQTLQAVQGRGQGLEMWEITAIEKIIKTVHVEHIEAHHKNEDDYFVPELRKRFYYPEQVSLDAAFDLKSKDASFSISPV